MRLLNNKKGGDFQAGKWLVILVIYFMFFIFTANGVSNLYTESDVSELSVSDSNFDYSSLIGENVCSNPRYYYDPTSLDTYEYSNVNVRNLECDESIGVKSQTICESINGCVWENVTSGLWFWETTEAASCLGKINASYYGINTSTIFKGEVVAAHDNTPTFGAATPCNHPNVLENQSLCDIFSCTWQKVEIADSYTSSSSVVDTVKELFTFRYDFGFSDNVNSIVIFIFFIIPLIMIIVSIYYMLPFAH